MDTNNLIEKLRGVQFCTCGSEQKKVLQNVTTRYKGKHIRIESVPSLVCLRNDTHVTHTMRTRRNIRNLLSIAYTNDWSHILYRELGNV